MQAAWWQVDTAVYNFLIAPPLARFQLTNTYNHKYFIIPNKYLLFFVFSAPSAGENRLIIQWTAAVETPLRKVRLCSYSNFQLGYQRH